MKSGCSHGVVPTVLRGCAKMLQVIKQIEKCQSDMGDKHGVLAGVVNNLKTDVSCGQENMDTVCTRVGKLEKEFAECKDGVTSVLEKHSDLAEVVSGLKSVCNHEENEVRVGELEAKSVVLKEQIDNVTQT